MVKWTSLSVVLLIGGLCLAASSCTTVPAGHVGVQSLFGKVANEPLYEGIHFVNPLANVEKLRTQLQEVKEDAITPSKEGLNIHLEVSCLYSLNPATAPQVYRTIGANYKEVVVTPPLRSAIRGVTVQHEAKDLYTSGREVIAQQIKDTLYKTFSEKGIILDNILLRKIELPQTITQAIEAKQAADQEAQRMQYVLQKERQEAERKAVEARGIAEFQKIVQEGLNDRYLSWKGIEATEILAKSPNSKIVIIGGGKNGLPLLLNAN